VIRSEGMLHQDRNQWTDAMGDLGMLPASPRPPAHAPRQRRGRQGRGWFGTGGTSGCLLLQEAAEEREQEPDER
jgi:hypothetical protein